MNYYLSALAFLAKRHPKYVFLKFLNPLNTNIFISQKIHFTLHVIFTLRLNVNCSIIDPVTKRL